jgi:hypothetical protein
VPRPPVPEPPMPGSAVADPFFSSVGLGTSVTSHQPT